MKAQQEVSIKGGSKNLFLTRRYTTESLAARVKQVRPTAELSVNFSYIPAYVTVNDGDQESSILSWSETHILAELNELAGFAGEFTDIVCSEEEGQVISFFWEASYNETIRKFIFDLNETDLEHYFQESKNFYLGLNGLYLQEISLLITYQMIRFFGVSSLIPHIPSNLEMLKSRQFPSSLLSMIFIWLIFTWEKIHNKTFPLPPRGEMPYHLYLPVPPSVLINDIFKEKPEFDVLFFDDESIFSGLKLTNTCPGMADTITLILKLMV